MSETLAKDVKELTKRAKGATPAILEIISATVGPAVKELATPICKAMTIYGCRNQIAITRAVAEINPLFNKIADRYFELVNETVRISLDIDSKNYDIILDAIMKDEAASIETKTELAKDMIATIKSQNRETMKTVISTAGKAAVKSVALVCVTSIGVSLIGLEKVKVKTNGGCDKTEIIMDGMKEIAKELNPLNSVKDIVKIVVDKTH